MGAVNWGGKRRGAGPRVRVDGAVVAGLRKRRRKWDQIAEELGISKWTAMKAFARHVAGVAAGAKEME